MQPRRISLIQSKEIASGTMAFYFSKPDGFTQKAGQYMDIALIDPKETDSGGDMRTFTIASAPHEPELMIATRIRSSAYKRMLKSLAPGDEVEIRGMGGSFTLHNKVERGAVFIAGGIGITPFRSMVVDAVERNLQHRIVIFVSNRTSEEAAFFSELQELAKKHAQLTVVSVMTKEHGRITAEQITAATSDLHSPLYYTAGSMDFVQSVRDMLTGMGVDDDDIRSEDFPGY